MFVRRVPRLVVLPVVLSMLVAGCSGPSTPGSVAPSGGTDAVRPLVVDTDLSSDDLMALAYVVGLPGYQLRAITVEGTGVVHCPAGAGVAARVMSELGETIPVACGSDTPMGDGHPNPEQWRAAADAGFGLALADPRAPIEGDAVALLTRTLDEPGVPADVLAIGPLTTIARALEAKPALGSRIRRIVLMGGAFDVAGNVETDAEPGSAEWNIWADPVAAQRVFAAGVPIVEVPLDATNHVPLTPDFYAELNGGHEAGPADLVFELLARNPYLVGGSYFWDVLAAVFLGDPRVLELSDMRVRIGDGDSSNAGRTIRDPAGPTVQVAIHADAAVFSQRFLAVVRGGPARATPFATRGTLSIAYDGKRCTLAMAPSAPGVYAVAFNASVVERSVAILVSLHAGHAWREAVELAAVFDDRSSSPDWADLVSVPGSIAGVQPMITVPAGISGFACATVDANYRATAISLTSPFTLEDGSASR